MPKPGEGEEEMDIDIDELFKPQEGSPPSNQSSSGEGEGDDTSLTETMTKRINTVREKTERETREAVAKKAGYENYAAMEKALEDAIVKKHGFDPNDVNAALTELLDKRLADDPRMKKLAEYEQREKDNYIRAQLTAINKAAGTQYKTAEELPREAIELWAKGIDLEQAFFATAGKTLITKGAASLQKGSTVHLASASASSGSGVKQRLLTDEEKDIQRSILRDAYPDSAELEKYLSTKTINIEGGQ